MIRLVSLQAAANLVALDIAIIALYFLGVFAIGLYFIRKGRPTADYFLAGRDAAWWAIGASLFSSNIGSEHFIGLAGSGAASGLAVGDFEWLAAMILLVLGWVFVPFYLRSNVYTMPEFLERRYNPACRTYLAAISLVAYVYEDIGGDLRRSARAAGGAGGGTCGARRWPSWWPPASTPWPEGFRPSSTPRSCRRWC